MKKNIIISVMMIVVLTTFIGCGLMHDDRSGCERIVPRISSYITGETFGLYILNGDNVVIEANIKVTTSDQEITTEKEVYHRDEYTYFLYSPYNPDPEGIPEKGDVCNTRNPWEFFRGFTKNVSYLRVGRGEFKSYGPCVIFFRMESSEFGLKIDRKSGDPDISPYYSI